MRLLRNRYVADFYLDDDKFVTLENLEPVKRRLALIHSKSKYSVDSRPGLRRIMEESQLTVCKVGGGFTGEEFLMMKKKADSMGCKIQWLIKEAHGGGRGARAWGHIYLSKENIIEKILKEKNIWEEFSKLPKTKQITRIQKFMSEMEPFKRKPRVKIGKAFPYEGLIFANPSYMKECDIPFGAKTSGPTKGLLVPTTIEMEDCDILVPENENKLKLPADKLADNMALFPRLIPELLFSKNLKRKFSKEVGRNPQQGFDLASITHKMPRKEWLQDAKDIYDGKADPQKIAELLFSYEMPDGTMAFNAMGQRILNGEDLHKPDIWLEAQKALYTIARSSLQPRIEGIYGVAMPKFLLKAYNVHGERVVGWLTRFPWTLPILTTVEVWNHCVFVDEEIWNAFGGDYDGDQGAVFERDSFDGELIWKRDKEWIKQCMKMPVKEDPKDDPRCHEEIIAEQLIQLEGCGKVFNASKIAVDAGRYAEMSGKQLLEMEIKLQAREVQPYIDGIKYKHQEGKQKNAFDLAKEYGSQDLLPFVMKSQNYFNAVRSRGACLEKVILMAKDADPKSPSFYERIISLFADWELHKYEEKDPAKLDKSNAQTQEDKSHV